jgi:hypothetical protein
VLHSRHKKLMPFENYNLRQNITGYCFQFEFIKGTVRPDWICMRVVPLESPLKGHKPLYVFYFFISVLNI